MPTIAGRAPIETYLLERHVAKHPTIIVTDPARELLVGGQPRPDGLHLPSQLRNDPAHRLAYLPRELRARKRPRLMHNAASAAKAIVDRLLPDTKAEVVEGS